MIPLLVKKFGAQRISYILFGGGQIIIPLSFIYANDQKLHTIQTNLIRGFVLMILNFGIVRYYEMRLDYKYEVNFRNILKRNIIMVIHGLAMTVSQFYLPLPIVHTINFFAPIFIFIIDYFENGVKISKIQFFFLIFSILGLLCTINNQLIKKILDQKYQTKSQFKNYIKLQPKQFSLYALLLISVMFLWAYGLLRVRTYYQNNHTYVNFHFGLMFTIVSGILYPYQVKNKTDINVLFNAIFLTGLPLALGQLGLVAGLALNKNTGKIVILTGLPVVVGYVVSYFRYGQIIEKLELFGSIMILIGLTGIINCDEVPLNDPLKQNILIGDGQRRSVVKYFLIM